MRTSYTAYHMVYKPPCTELNRNWETVSWCSSSSSLSFFFLLWPSVDLRLFWFFLSRVGLVAYEEKSASQDTKGDGMIDRPVCCPLPPAWTITRPRDRRSRPSTQFRSHSRHCYINIKCSKLAWMMMSSYASFSWPRSTSRNFHNVHFVSLLLYERTRSEHLFKVGVNKNLPAITQSNSLKMISSSSNSRLVPLEIRNIPHGSHRSTATFISLNVFQTILSLIPSFLSDEYVRTIKNDQIVTLNNSRS